MMHREGCQRVSVGNLIVETLRRGAGSMDAAPPSIAGPAAARTATVFRFAFSDPPKAKDRSQRREAVAEYLAALPGAAIVAEQRERNRCWVWVRLVRPASIEATREFLGECPYYVPSTCTPLGG